jgi:hypothetical protein
MALMNIEQLDLAEDQPDDGPPDDGRRRPAAVGPLIWVAFALVALVAGFLVIGPGEAADSAPTFRRPSPSAAPAIGKPAPNQRQYLGVTTVCSPVTDGRRTLAVSFEVSNVSPVPVAVDSVVGVLPQRGLRQHGPATRGGDCERAGTQDPSGTIPAGQAQFYTLTFDLPRRCPARYPVQVRVDFRAGAFDETSLSLLYPDLSVPDFETCAGKAEPK